MTDHRLSTSKSGPADLELEAIFNAALHDLVKKEPRPKLEARFYPYAGLSSTIRLRQNRVYVRVSDILTDSPAEVLYSLACILVAKLYRRKAPNEHLRNYRNYTSNPRVLDASEAARRKRGYKLITPPRGKVYDLDELFTDLNARYFGGELERPLLSWSRQKTRRVLGHHDHVHTAIVISRTLDQPNIPRFVIEYVLYHEMLHVKHPPKAENGRTIYHSRRFRLDEKRFERLEEALKWLDKIALPVRRRRPRKRPAGPANRGLRGAGTK